MIKKNILTVWIANNSVDVYLYAKNRFPERLFSGSFEQFLENPKWVKIRHTFKSLAVIFPDEWIKKSFFPFQSQKKKYIRPFLHRQIKQITNGDVELSRYYYYFSVTKETEKKGISVYHLIDRKGIEILKALGQLGLNISLITTPGLIWGEKLRKFLTKGSIQNLALLIHGKKDSQLYFFHRENFEFSRGLNLGEYTSPKDAFQTLTFELNQSMIYFSQKYKSEVEVVCLIDESSMDNLQEKIEQSVEKRIIKINKPLTVNSPSLPANQDQETPIKAYFNAQDFQLIDEKPNLLPESVQKVLNRAYFQRVGIVVGLTLLAILLAQSVWLYARFSHLNYYMHLKAFTADQREDATLSRWDEASNSIIAKASLPSATEFMSEIGQLSSPFLELENVEMDLYSDKEVRISGRIKTDDLKIFRSTIESILVRLKKILPTRVQLNWDKVSFHRDFEKQNIASYIFEIRTDL